MNERAEEVWRGPERRKPLIAEQEQRDKECADEEKRYMGYLFWCSEGCGFVSRHHQCEQWTHLTYIPPKAIEAIQQRTQAAALTQAKREGVEKMRGKLQRAEQIIQAAMLEIEHDTWQEKAEEWCQEADRLIAELEGK